jgi:hypothetical protein
LVSTIRVFTASLQVMKHALEYINRRLQIEEESNISLVGHYMSEHNISQCVSLTRIYLWMVGIFFSMGHLYWEKMFTSSLGECMFKFYCL